MMYPNATHGLERVYQSQVIALVAAVLMIIPVINMLAAIALIVSLVLYMIGINEAGKDDGLYLDYRAAGHQRAEFPHRRRYF